MSNEHYLRDKYPDLLGGEEDPALIRLIGGLDALSSENNPSTHVVRSIGSGLLERSGRRRSRSRAFSARAWIPRRLVTTTVGLLLVPILAGATYTMVPVIEKAFTVDPGTARIVTENLGIVVNQSRSVKGFTLTVQRVYADANQVAVGYTVTGPPGRTFNSFMVWGKFDQSRYPRFGAVPTLIDGRGHTLSAFNDIYGTGVEGGKYGQVMRYNAPVGLETRRRIALHFQVGTITAVESVREHELRVITVTAPLRFNFTVPVTPGRVANLHHIVNVAGAKVTLDRVVATRVGTRVSLRGMGPIADVRLIVDGKRYRLSFDGARPNHWAAKSVWEYMSSVDLVDKGGEWMLLVKAPATASKARQWAFRFMVPPVSRLQER